MLVGSSGGDQRRPCYWKSPGEGAVELNLKGRIAFHHFINRDVKCIFDPKHQKSIVTRAKDFFFFNLGHDGWLNLNFRNLHGRITKILEWHGEKEELVCRW